MLVNRDTITCDECGARIEPRQKSGDWKNIFTAKAHVCEGCWETEMDRTWLVGVGSWEGVTAAIKKNKYPAETFVGRILIEDDIVQKVMGKFSTSQT